MTEFSRELEAKMAYDKEKELEGLVSALRGKVASLKRDGREAGFQAAMAQKTTQKELAAVQQRVERAEGHLRLLGSLGGRVYRPSGEYMDVWQAAVMIGEGSENVGLESMIGRILEQQADNQQQEVEKTDESGAKASLLRRVVERLEAGRTFDDAEGAFVYESHESEWAIDEALSIAAGQEGHDEQA